MLLYISLLLPAWAIAECQQCPVNYTKDPLDFVKIFYQDYERNADVEFCRRPIEMVDTIVLHHSATTPARDPSYLNGMHLDEGYHMIGYSFVISSPYPGHDHPVSRITAGRPLEFVGSHAGSDVYLPMTPAQKKMWDDKKVRCGKIGTEFSVNSRYEKNGKILANVSTIGVVVVGNYAPATITNINGYVLNRQPTQQTLMSIAKLSCQLQKKHPTIKKLSWHGSYRKTLCPGDLKKYMSQIKNLTKSLGCAFY